MMPTNNIVEMLATYFDHIDYPLKLQQIPQVLFLLQYGILGAKG